MAKFQVRCEHPGCSMGLGVELVNDQARLWFGNRAARRFILVGKEQIETLIIELEQIRDQMGEGK